MNRTLLALTASLAALSGCDRLAPVGTILGRNVGAAFSSPREVKDKIEEPRRADAGLAVLWVGHATVLIQIDDKYVMTDPVFTQTVGLVSKRLVEPGLLVSSVPKLDAVVISHLHFDHLSLGTLDLLEDRIGVMLMPPNGARYAPGLSFPIEELARFASWERDGLRITAVPVAHVGWRYGVDQAWMRAFSGYVVEYHGKSVYFGGDTAYAKDMFDATRARFPSLDLAILPISPIHPRDFMKRTHVDPEEAIRARVASNMSFA